MQGFEASKVDSLGWCWTLKAVLGIVTSQQNISLDTSTFTSGLQIGGARNLILCEWKLVGAGSL